MHLLTIVILHILLKYNLHFFIAIANDHEMTQNKNQVRTPMISKRIFFVETKKYKSSKDYSCCNVKWIILHR